MKKDLEVRIHVVINGVDRLWETLTEEQQKEIGMALNDRALRSIGYVPESEEKTA